MNQEPKVVNAFEVEAMGIKFRWECPHCFLDQYSETMMKFGDTVRRVCEDPDCGKMVHIKIEEELLDD